MADILALIAAEKENVERTLTGVDETLARRPLGRIELAALAAFLHNLYNGAENVLKQVIRERGGEVPSGSAWHKDLLDLAISSGVITPELGRELYEYLAFRHFFVHGYAMTLKENQLLPLAQKARSVLGRFWLAVEGPAGAGPG